MRVLNTTTLELELFGAEVPPYAILSHRWEDEEVTLNDLLPGGKALEMKGYFKLENSARVAREEGYDFLWIDTCCIDKSSSAELSEAINSMFQWYKESGRCIVYLSDVAETVISESRWFTRGWTLQELIAPAKVSFYDMFWAPLGTKDSLQDQIHSATGIPLNVLAGADLGDIPACRKMSWAAGRKITRPEDMAYCLLGLFDVNIPLLYGEGAEKAFVRLQETFVRQSDDESIFAWSASSVEAIKKPYWGLLAATPDCFGQSGLYSIPRFKTWRRGGTTEVTNKGLRLSLNLERCPGDLSETIFLAPLNCSFLQTGDSDLSSAFTILLQRVSDFEEQFTRIRPDRMVPLPDDCGFGYGDLTATSRESRHLFVNSYPTNTDPVFGFLVNQKQEVRFEFPTNSARGPVVYQGLACAQFSGVSPWNLFETAPKVLSLQFDSIATGLSLGCSQLKSAAFGGDTRGKFHVNREGYRPSPLPILNETKENTTTARA